MEFRTMAIVAAYDWESDTWTNNGENPTRQTWSTAVAEIADKAKAALPECHGRIEKAVSDCAQWRCRVIA